MTVLCINDKPIYKTSIKLKVGELYEVIETVNKEYYRLKGQPYLWMIKRFSHE